MRTFRLKYLFCLILVIGVSLMWWTWYSSSELTANLLLVAREKSKAPPQHFDPRDTSKWLGLNQWTDGEVRQRPLFPIGLSMSYFGQIECDWTESIILFVDPRNQIARIDKNRVYRKSTETDYVISWVADWPAIEAKAVEENRTFYCQIAVTVVAGLFAGWLVWPRW
jgi:hypothetical protein